MYIVDLSLFIFSLLITRSDLVSFIRYRCQVYNRLGLQITNLCNTQKCIGISLICHGSRFYMISV